MTTITTIVDSRLGLGSLVTILIGLGCSLTYYVTRLLQVMLPPPEVTFSVTCSGQPEITFFCNRLHNNRLQVM